MAESKLTHECKVELVKDILTAIKEAGYKSREEWNAHVDGVDRLLTDEEMGVKDGASYIVNAFRDVRNRQDEATKEAVKESDE